MKPKVLLIGASSGGPSQIKELLSSIVELPCSIIVVQHMKEEVLPFYIKDLQDSLTYQVLSTPCKTDFLNPCVIICSKTSSLHQYNSLYCFEEDNTQQYYTPDINTLFFSFEAFIDTLDIFVYIMTGIGNDGVEGAAALNKKGIKIYAQDEKSSPVYGMPKAALERGIVEKVKSLEEMKMSLKEINGFF